MTTPSAFFDKLMAVKPEDDLKPGQILVAVLQCDITPTQPFEQQDALWIRCRQDTEIARVLDAYKKQCPDAGEVVLRHDFRVLDEKTAVRALADRPPYNFVALETIRVQDLHKRMGATPVRTPLSDVTNVVKKTISQGTATSKAIETPSGQRSIPPKPQVTLASTPPVSAHVASHLPQPAGADHSLASSEQLGWEDFFFERHECYNPATGHHSRRPDSEYYALDKSIHEEWLALTSGQKSYFNERGVRIASISNSADPIERRIGHWAFWCFYYDNYIKTHHGPFDPHHDFDTRWQHIERWRVEWTKLSSHGRRVWMDKVRSHTVAAVERGILDRPESLVSSARSSPLSDTDTDSLKLGASPDPKPGNNAIHQFDGPTEETDFHIPLEDAPNSQGPAPTRLSMAELFDNRTPEQLEKSVEKGVELLSGIQRTLKAQPSQDADQWLQALENVQKQAVRSKTVVGVVGATGAGKSSVINAMLDEERLVPTNCMRACTAVVTEISYNYEEGAAYRAEVEFISRENWHQQLKILFQDLLDGSGQVSRECNNEDHESGVAYAQVKAVYPTLTKEEMEHVPIERLLQHENVACLGTTRNLESDDSLTFYKKLQHYVDSKEKSSATKEKPDFREKKKKPREMEFWPLIRVVRLYVKAPALATGAVIVDLPGVHDSNQARAAVAQGYMKQCTGLWIVAPITRAVDDKSAKNLLGESFKRQLKMDGGYSSVTFICSKTDDISITEAQDSLGLEEEFDPVWAKSEALRKKEVALKKQINELKDTRSDISAAIDFAEEGLEVWEKLQEECNEGKPVFKPQPKSQKRKRTEKNSPARKKSKYVEPDTDDDFIDDDGDSDSDAGSNHASSDATEDRGEPLREDDIQRKIAELRGAKKERRRERLKLDDQLKGLRQQMDKINQERDGIDAELSARCISGRNEYSRAAIRQDYAAGIRELDQELAEEEDAANFNPDVDARDYGEVARNLPVFCVSSRAYQKLKGRLPKDKTPPGFKHVDETEIPALQDHCIQLTTAGRQAFCRKFLNSMYQLLNSLRLWASNDGTSKNLSEGQLKREAQILKEKLSKLDCAFEKAVTAISSGLGEELQDKVYGIYPTATQAAKAQANDTVRKWGMPVNRDNRAAGGLYWATYKAVVRRDGCFTNAHGNNNFNEQLVEPVLRHLAGPWESLFARRMPGILNGLPMTVGQLITKFHNEVEGRAVRNGVSIASFHMLKQQIPVYKEMLKDAMTEMRGRLSEKQREINREFEPQIKAHMMDTYEWCTRESGPGQYKRMRDHMERHVEEEKFSMFNDAVEHVRGLLEELLDDTKEEMLKRIDAVFMAIERDYTAVVVGQEKSANSDDVLPRGQRAMRKAVLEIIDGAELIFKRAVGLELEASDPEAAGGHDIKTEEDSLDTLHKSNKGGGSPASMPEVSIVVKTEASASIEDIPEEAAKVDSAESSQHPENQSEVVQQQFRHNLRSTVPLKPTL
ncbi:uncharacterized protein Z518_10223 [Rhinocladiella mackenziei CBS 650.93]|uniref:Rhinocladiella mackenziei CBS 650.93 unplaced genomic scaffold supercont1.9, whole genome shotgun sequence n=1 Tax=Rhinocladiella mackenziei CBS 650.93 TaxID=1442369 RepID=A0A0D2IA14_9EURO|nr:uncharacterized protein Z518_10223 [Rhinocladiella mackenziei CBS 650.93]KIX00086.1 hypothetical protein Z518_10223 [Rhinocladiella mackenziei CBS 650.93]